VATETDAARDRVLAARASLGEELETLEASARSAIDIPAKIKRSPAKAAAVVGGTAFLALGGPRRVFRAGKRAVTGEPEPLPPSMLPKEIDKTLKGLGSDGEKVRGTIEREFAAYLEQTAPVRNKRDLNAVTAIILSALARPIIERFGKQLIEQVFSTDADAFQAQLDKVRARTRSTDATQTPPPPAP